MSSSDLTADDGYQSLLGKISEVYATGQTRATQAVNAHITQTYWQIGRDIVEFEQGGNIRAEYGKRLVASLARDLSLRHGKGFSRSNVMMMKAFYLAFPKVQTLSGQLSWSHYVELLSISDGLERAFYEKQAVAEKWSVKELQRQKRTALFLRLAAGFAWVQHFIHHLAPQGMAGFVLANGSMSSNQSGECVARSASSKPEAKLHGLGRQRDIRRALIEADLVDCMFALPGQLFYSTGEMRPLFGNS